MSEGETYPVVRTMSQRATRSELVEEAETRAINVPGGGRSSDDDPCRSMAHWEEELCDLAVDVPLDLEVDMRRSHVASSRRIRPRLDGRESVPTVVVRPQQRVPLKVRIKRQMSVRIRWMGVPSVRVCLPDLNPVRCAAALLSGS